MCNHRDYWMFPNGDREGISTALANCVKFKLLDSQEPRPGKKIYGSDDMLCVNFHSIIADCEVFDPLDERNWCHAGEGVVEIDNFLSLPDCNSSPFRNFFFKSPNLCAE